MIKKIIDKFLIFFDKKTNLTISNLKIISFLTLTVISIYLLLLIPLFKYFNLKNELTKLNYKNEEIKNKNIILKKKFENSKKISSENKKKLDFLLKDLYYKSFSNSTSIKKAITDKLLKNNLYLKSISRLEFKIPQNLNDDNLELFQVKIPFELTGSISDFNIFFQEIELLEKYISILENDIIFEFIDNNLKIKFKITAFILHKKINEKLKKSIFNESQFKIGKLEDSDSLSSLITSLNFYYISKNLYLILTFMNGQKKTFSQNSNYKFKNKDLYIEFFKNKVIITDKITNEFLVKYITK